MITFIANLDISALYLNIFSIQADSLFSLTPLYILLNIQGVVKISDFGLARYSDSPDCNLVGKATVFPIRWTAPEVFTENVLTKSSDVWSVNPHSAYSLLTYFTLKTSLVGADLHRFLRTFFCVHLLILLYTDSKIKLNKLSGVTESCVTSLSPEERHRTAHSRTDR